MPRLRNVDASPHRSKEELEAFRASLPEVLNPGCGHVGVSAQAYYSTGRSQPPGGGVCVDCYRTRAREAQRAKKFIEPLTIEDIRNPERKSGFDHVNSAGTGSDGHKNRTEQWRAEQRPRVRGRYGEGFVGRRRSTPEEAAQDYCDYINGLNQTAAPVTLNTPGHVRRKSVVKDQDPEVEAALGVLRDAKAQRAGRQGYVYCIGEQGGSYAVKVGYSVNPEARVGELQTGNPRPLVLLAKQEGTISDERAIHAKFITDNTVGEWFVITPALLAEFGLDHKAIVGEIRP